MNSEHTPCGLSLPASRPHGTGSSSAIELVPLVSFDSGTEQHGARQSSQTSVANLSSTANSLRSSFRGLQKDTTLLLPSSPEKPSLLQKGILDTWICESAALVFSIACILAIVIIASVYDGRPASQLPSSVTLNTMVAVLSTSARSALMFVVSATVGQLKWCWLRKSSRKLQDIQAIDEGQQRLTRCPQKPGYSHRRCSHGFWQHDHTAPDRLRAISSTVGGIPNTPFGIERHTAEHTTELQLHAAASP